MFYWKRRTTFSVKTTPAHFSTVTIQLTCLSHVILTRSLHLLSAAKHESVSGIIKTKNKRFISNFRLVYNRHSSNWKTNDDVTSVTWVCFEKNASRHAKTAKCADLLPARNKISICDHISAGKIAPKRQQCKVMSD